MATFDVEKMYNNINEELGRGSCKEYLESRNLGGGSEEELVTTKSILEALDLCIKNNFFQFNGKIYKQEGGVGTGVKLAPPICLLRDGQIRKYCIQ